MPAVAPERLVSAITSAIADSGYTATLASGLRSQPRRFLVAGQNAPEALTVYAWSLTFGGRPTLPNEYRIQMTTVRSPLPMGTGGPTILIGYDATRNLFAGFDLERIERSQPVPRLYR